MKIAQEKGLPELKHHILPRTKGFILLLQGAENRSKFLISNIITVNLQYLETRIIFRVALIHIIWLYPFVNLVAAVYDLTVGFKKAGAPPTLLSILKGRACQAEIFVK